MVVPMRFELILVLLRREVAYPIGRWDRRKDEVERKRGSVRGRSFLWDGCRQPPLALYPTVMHEQCTVCLRLLRMDSPVSAEHYLGSSLLRVSPGHPGPVVSWHVALGAPTFLWFAKPAIVSSTSRKRPNLSLLESGCCSSRHPGLQPQIFRSAHWYPLRESNPCTLGVGQRLYH